MFEVGLCAAERHDITQCWQVVLQRTAYLPVLAQDKKLHEYCSATQSR